MPLISFFPPSYAFLATHTSKNQYSPSSPVNSFRLASDKASASHSP